MNNEHTIGRRTNPTTDSDNEPIPAGTSNAWVAGLNCQGTVAGRFGLTTAAQASVASGRYEAPLDERAATAGFAEAAPDQIVKLEPGQKNTFVYEATAGSSTSLSSDYIKLVPVTDGKES
jgi:hypothetical protein